MGIFGARMLKGLTAAAAAVCAAVCAAVGTAAYSKDTKLLKAYEQEAKKGTVNVAVKGTFYANEQEAVDLLNQFRLEACTEGVWDPRDPSRRLTKADYVPIKWSYDLEQTARLRAAESSVKFSHERPNGDWCFSAQVGDLSGGNAEGIASWGEDMRNGLWMFYSEKEDWVNKDENAVTGHYTSMINPDYQYVGLGSFDTLCARYSWSKGSSSKMSGTLKDVYVPIQILSGDVSGHTIKTVSGKTKLVKGGSCSLELTAKLYDWADCLLYKAKWSSSDTSVATVDKYGKVTAVGKGTATITAASGSVKKTVKITVQPSVEDCKVTIPYASYTYRGRGIKPTVTVRDGSVKLVKDTDYTVSYSDNINVGTATITVTGKGKYLGKTVKRFTVKPLDVSTSYAKATIPYASYTYTGKAITPALRLTFKDGSVIPESEYSWVCINNIKVGKAEISVVGRGTNVKGLIKKTFVVKPAKQTINKITTTTGLFRIYWNKDPQASGYQVLYSKDKSFVKDVHSWTTFDLNDTSEGFSRVPTSGETWYVKVRSFTAQNNTRYGNYSAVKSIKVK